MRSACPLTKADDFQGHCAIETLLARQINYPLTAARNFLQQLVIAEISRQLCNALTPCGMLAFRYSACVLVLPRKCAKSSSKKATWAAAFRRVGRDFRAALLSESGDIDHGFFSSQSFLSSLFPKEKCGRNCKRSADQKGKSLLPAVIHYGAWRKGDAYVFNHRLGAPRMPPEANGKDFA